MKVTQYKSFDEMPEFISMPQAAAVLGISGASLYRYADRDKTFPVITMGRRHMVPTKQLEKWIDDQVKKRGN